MTGQRKQEAVVHVRLDGRSLDVPLHHLGVGHRSGDDLVKRALARYLEVPARALRGHVIERHPSGNLTARPELVLR